MSAIVWSEAARALFDLRTHTGVEAGAGSGKTTCLVELAVRLLSGEATGQPLPPEALVAITFTDKAAEELAERLRQAVEARAAAAPEGSAAALAWRERRAGLERLEAGTIHGFTARLLREHAPEAGIDPEFVQLDEEEAGALRRGAARAAVVAALDAGRPEAAALAALHGAGGGRAGLAELVADLVRQQATRGREGPPPLAPAPLEEALAARAGLARAAERVLAAAGGLRAGARRDAIDRFAAAWRALPAGDLDGPLDPEARLRLLDAAGAEKGGRGGGDLLQEAARALREAAGEFGDLSAGVLGRPQAEELARLAGEAQAGYARAKAEAAALDFDDLLLRARDLLAGDPALLGELRGRIRALLLDEVQDVNAVQQEIADLFTGPESPERPGLPALLVAVGDPKQSIYRFRGADVAVFRRLLDRLEAGAARGEGRVLRLSENHRSTPGVLELVNAISARAMQPQGQPPLPFELAFGDADRLRPVRPGGLSPACEVLEDDNDGDGGGDAAARREREARAVAARVLALTSGQAGVALPDGTGGLRRPRLADVALLFRRLTQLAPYERALREAGIPCRLARGGGFYQAPEVRDLGELCALLVDPADALAWAALLRSPLCGLTDGSLVLLARDGLQRLAAARPGPAADGLRRRWEEIAGDPGREPERLARFLETFGALRARRDRLPQPELLEEAQERLDLEVALLAAPDGERRRDNLRKLLALARRHDAAGGGLGAFAARLRRLAEQPPREAEAELPAGDAVAVISVHQAKGLEWPVVFLPDLGAGMPNDTRRAALDGAGRLCASWADGTSGEHQPTAALAAARAEGRRAAAAESRRLLYVALTRARDYLVLSGEAGRGGDDWRSLVEAGLSGRPGLALRLPAAEAATRAVGPPVPEAPPPSLPPPPAPVPPRLAGPPPLAAVRVAVTDLAEYARCPTRHFLARRLRIPERAEGRGSPFDDPERATDRGTLAHAVLAELDLAAPPLEVRARMASCARRLGHDPSAEGTRRVLGDLTRFLASPGGLWLAGRARAGALRREVPFLLRLEGQPACYLVGAIDALAEDGDGLAVIDFKYALARPEAAERYRLQLCAYALAASRAHPGRPVRAALQFLRGRCDRVDVTPAPEAREALARQAPALAAGLHLAAAPTPPEALGRTRERCQAEGCGFVARCHPRVP